MSKSTQPTETLSFHVSGMHCASCANTITRALKKTPGVEEASVNYANEQATVRYSTKKDIANDLEAAVKKVGYTAHVHDHDNTDISEEERTKELTDLKSKLLICGALSAVLVATMIPGFPMVLKNPWLLWALATPVQFWG